MDTTSPPSLTDLPNEVLIHIAGDLADFDDVSALAGTNKLFRSLLDNDCNRKAVHKAVITGSPLYDNDVKLCRLQKQNAELFHTIDQEGLPRDARIGSAETFQDCLKADRHTVTDSEVQEITARWQQSRIFQDLYEDPTLKSNYKKCKSYAYSLTADDFLENNRLAANASVHHLRQLLRTPPSTSPPKRSTLPHSRFHKALVSYWLFTAFTWAMTHSLPSEDKDDANRRSADLCSLWYRKSAVSSAAMDMLEIQCWLGYLLGVALPDAPELRLWMKDKVEAGSFDREDVDWPAVRAHGLSDMAQGLGPPEVLQLLLLCTKYWSALSKDDEGKLAGLIREIGRSDSYGGVIPELEFPCRHFSDGHVGELSFASLVLQPAVPLPPVDQNCKKNLRQKMLLRLINKYRGEVFSWDEEGFLEVMDYMREWAEKLDLKVDWHGRGKPKRIMGRCTKRAIAPKV